MLYTIVMLTAGGEREYSNLVRFWKLLFMHAACLISRLHTDNYFLRVVSIVFLVLRFPVVRLAAFSLRYTTVLALVARARKLCIR